MNHSTLYTNNKLSAKEILKNRIYNSIKTKRNLGINIIKEVKDPYIENYKRLMKEIEDDSKTWKFSVLMDWKKNNIVKRNILNKIIYRFSTIPNKTSVEYFTELEQIF